MSYIISNSLKTIFNQLKMNTELTCFSQRFEFMELLKILNATERHLLATYFCKLPWNIGSLYVLAVLQKLRILTATEFILSLLKRNQDVQLILNDFLEAEYELINNLIINATFQTFNICISGVLEECLENLFQDLLKKPELNDLSYLSCFKNQLPFDILLPAIQRHIAIILRLHEANITTAFSKLSTWINEGVDDLKFPKDFYEKLLFDHIEDSLNYLLKLSTEENFRGWKFFVIILQTVSSSNNKIIGPFIHKYLRTRIKQSIFLNKKETLMHMLLTARAVTATDMNIHKNLNNYAYWYKANIGEMKFYLKTDEFQVMLHLLEECIDYEMEEDYLEVYLIVTIHATIVISPPVLCGKMVHSYKSKCKQRLRQIKNGLHNVDINESIVIEDNN